jgi:hypothetical protein
VPEASNRWRLRSRRRVPRMTVEAPL